MDKYFKIGNLSGAAVLTILLSLLAFVLALLFPSRHRTFVFLAMLVSSVGDFLLMYRGSGKNGVLQFLLGAAAFMIAHILYAFAYGSRLNPFSLNGGSIFTLSLFVLGVIAIFYMYHKGHSSVATLCFVLLYFLVICTANLTVSVYAFSVGKFAIFALIGSVCFILSDFFIGMNLLLQNNRAGHLIWWFYPIGQMLLILCG